jgi:hypothetical protein
MDVQSYMNGVGRAARAASRETARADTRARNEALLAMASAIERDAATLLAANAADVEQARARLEDPLRFSALAPALFVHGRALQQHPCQVSPRPFRPVVGWIGDVDAGPRVTRARGGAGGAG